MASSNFCGTGTWGNAPKPGDPSFGSVLQAVPVFGGIDVSWTYPEVNSHAVAHTRLYRSTNGTDETPILWSVVSGNFFYDKNAGQSPVEYFYWIEFVSINGTVGERIGPASAVARPTISQTIEMLTGQIDNGALAESLKTEIGKIGTNKLEIDQALLDQAASDDALAASISQLLAYSDETRAMVQEEALARADENAAFAAAVNTVQAELGDSLASVQTEMAANIDTVNGKITEIGAQYTAKVDVNGLIGGFGVFNDGTEVEAGFDVDRFWVGRTGEENKKKPFIIENGEVFIDKGAIGSISTGMLVSAEGTPVTTASGLFRADTIDVGNLKVAEAAEFTGDVFSTNFESGVSGWAILQDGYVEFNEAMIRGNLEVQTITVNGNAPFSGFGIEVGNYNYSRGIGTSGWSYTKAGDKTLPFVDVPGGAKVTGALNTDSFITITTKGGGSYTYCTSDGGDGAPSGCSTRYRTAVVSGSIKVRYRAWVNGTLIKDVSSPLSGTLSASSGTSSKTIRVNVQETFDYTVPEFTPLLEVRSRIELVCSNLTLNTTADGREGSLSMGHNNLLMSGDLNRLGG